ncbi:hypothetical protein EYF80_047587 [Liparis tanakae]|uniref:Uncharacterized protein n=1 Tax=Liparis tanakae TaxID=230148 RepID=A0A4Z2FLY5_9TELE|nr:hypothetical protein EYF80_047587 [Liparis tanakae]
MALFCGDSCRLPTSQGSSSLAFFCAIRQTICRFWFAGAGRSGHSSSVSMAAGCPAARSSASYCFFKPFRYIRKLSGSSLEFLAVCRRRVASLYTALCLCVSGSL